ASIARREFFVDAATLFAMDEEAAGRTPPEWSLSPKAGDLPPKKRRRRRRRRRRGGGSEG
ncbi:MAG: hypothetical protein AAF645_15145, partial [Myxococcota bacterium]